MAKRNRSIDQIDGQMCFDLSTDRLQYVVQANRLIEGKQNLKLNSAKILRLLIMQIKPDDDDFKTSNKNRGPCKVTKSNVTNPVSRY